jgi:hypothetical protein
MEIFRVNAPYLPWRACVRGVKEGLWCTHWPQHSSLGAGQLIDDTCHLGKDAGWSPGPAPARLALAMCRLQTWPPHRVGAGHRKTRVSLGPEPGQGPRARCYRTRGGLNPGPSRGGVAGHMVALGLALVKRATPAVVDLVLVFGLSRYLGVPIPRGTDS